MRLYLLFTILFISISGVATAHKHSCSNEGKHKSAAKGTSATAEEDDYDVLYVKLNMNMENTSTKISGSTITQARVLINAFTVYAFELSNQLTIDSFKFNNQLEPVVRTGSVCKVNLPVAYPQNTVFTAEVFYHGQPTSGTGFFTHGLNHVQLPSGTHLMYTLSDMYLAEDWWACKQNINDKIDSADIWITVADSLKAGSNGLLQGVTPMPGNMSRYEWKTRYPIDYYLISVAVAPYSEYSYYMHFTDGSGDSMLVQNYVYDSASYMTPARVAALDTTGYIIDHFSKLFGKYPFYKEKYGHCIAEPLGGGMEHQTMTTLAYSEPTLIAHELGHQWWGDAVTYGSWADIWLSEGFATYCEQLYIEHFRSVADALAKRTTVFNTVISGPGTAGGTVYVDDTTSASRVFNSRLTYAKGASVTHMLRYMAPHDDLFFDVLRTYQQQYKFGHALTPDLQNIAEATYGIDLDTFFSQWIYKEGYPTYTVKWYQTGSTFYLLITQTTSRPTSVPYFVMPIQVKLLSASGDTMVTVYNSAAWQGSQFTTGKTITGVEVDPDNHILNKVAGITNDPAAAIDDLSINPVEISPNPSANGWHVRNLPGQATLRLTDITGKVVWKDRASDSITIPSQQLPAGNYLLTITQKDRISKNYKLTK